MLFLYGEKNVEIITKASLIVPIPVALRMFTGLTVSFSLDLCSTIFLKSLFCIFRFYFSPLKCDKDKRRVEIQRPGKSYKHMNFFFQINGYIYPNRKVQNEFHFLFHNLIGAAFSSR